ncbi:uncharacterized protein ANIA_11553 [Aspergillus nidulans FGSC A4]|uniref:Uncharacterized protein n=1 Tax=Emericella nidulans (strain FGSC A4 / ATCC 38163 / CBS 112.46 / NRRL 194 / M139) TaxID=227321 RepID=C8VCQ3_EMENI|nr:hypothetical protein [Aspergillus nidulans FGSC A4]CBF78662.1 TPA: hypothetical protein ANIA_11553 [Aspergillus nidulans FGSC A4]
MTGQVSSTVLRLRGSAKQCSATSRALFKHYFSTSAEKNTDPASIQLVESLHQKNGNLSTRLTDGEVKLIISSYWPAIISTYFSFPGNVDLYAFTP